MERKLAAILAADIVGYSRLMGEDETGTLERLKSLRKELVQPRIAERTLAGWHSITTSTKVDSSLSIERWGMNKIMTIDPQIRTASPQATCPWCDIRFSTRQNGGKPQRFCCPACRRNFHDSLRRWAFEQWEMRQVTTETLHRLKRAL